MHITCHLADLIRKSGKTQDEFAQQLECYQTDVSDWCLGKRTPAFKTMLRIGKLLDKRIEEIWEPVFGRPPKRRE